MAVKAVFEMDDQIKQWDIRYYLADVEIAKLHGTESLGYKQLYVYEPEVFNACVLEGVNDDSNDQHYYKSFFPNERDDVQSIVKDMLNGDLDFNTQIIYNKYPNPGKLIREAYKKNPNGFYKPWNDLDKMTLDEIRDYITIVHFSRYNTYNEVSKEADDYIYENHIVDLLNEEVCRRMGDMMNHFYQIARKNTMKDEWGGDETYTLLLRNDINSDVKSNFRRAYLITKAINEDVYPMDLVDLCENLYYTGLRMYGDLVYRDGIKTHEIDELMIDEVFNNKKLTVDLIKLTNEVSKAIDAMVAKKKKRPLPVGAVMDLLKNHIPDNK